MDLSDKAITYVQLTVLFRHRKSNHSDTDSFTSRTKTSSRSRA